MPRTKSAQKALRSSLRKRGYNLARQEGIKRLEREFRKVLTGKKKEAAVALLGRLYQAYDKAAKSRVISRPKAARKKHQAARLVNSMK